MKVELLSYTSEPEKIVAAAAKLCYRDTSASELLKDLDNDSIEKFIAGLASYGHESPFEHVSFTFSVEGVSRSLLAQITRHRIASFSVQSQRYVSQKNSEYIIPEEIKNCSEALKIFKEAMRFSFDSYDKISSILYDKYLSEEENEITRSKMKKLEKKAIENARAVLPNACETKMVVTMNARELYHFFELRCCNRAQEEIKELATKMYKLVYDIAPNLFKTAGPPCTQGICTQGSMCCGRYKEMVEKFNNIRDEVNMANAL